MAGSATERAPCSSLAAQGEIRKHSLYRAGIGDVKTIPARVPL